VRDDMTVSDVGQQAIHDLDVPTQSDDWRLIGPRGYKLGVLASSGSS
jgi:hypothetical protein